MFTFTWEDIQSYCDDLSDWIIETNTQDELIHASPKATFPLKADPEQDDLQEDLDILVYLTLWVCLKLKTKAPDHLESRIMLAPALKGPWKLLYLRLCAKVQNNEHIQEIWDLAS